VQAEKDDRKNFRHHCNTNSIMFDRI
jgi:hypothetical protein